MTTREIESPTVWNSFWETHGSNALFQSWIWGDVLKARGEKIWRLGFFEGSNLVGVAFANLVFARRGRFLHVRHGPILIDNKRWPDVLRELKLLASRQGAWFIRISPLVEGLPSGVGLVPSPIHAMDAELCWVLDLDKSEEELLSQMRKTTRYEIRRAQKLGVEIVRSTNVSDLSYFYQLYKETSDRHGFVPHVGIQKEFEVFVKNKKALLFLGKYNDKIMAAAIIIFYGNQAIYHHSASQPSNMGINYLLQWEAILEAKKRGMKVYNFWGIAPEDKPNHPWRGLTLFKKGFGGRQESFIHAHDLPISPFYIIPRAIESMRRFVKGY